MHRFRIYLGQCTDIISISILYINQIDFDYIGESILVGFTKAFFLEHKSISQLTSGGVDLVLEEFYLILYMYSRWWDLLLWKECLLCKNTTTWWRWCCHHLEDERKPVDDVEDEEEYGEGDEEELVDPEKKGERGSKTWPPI